MLAMQGEMGPVMPLDARSMAITRRGGCVLHVTPCQLQESNDVLLHEAKTSVGPEIWDLKQRRACRSVSVSSVMANGRQQKKANR